MTAAPPLVPFLYVLLGQVPGGVDEIDALVDVVTTPTAPHLRNGDRKAWAVATAAVLTPGAELAGPLSIKTVTDAVGRAHQMMLDLVERTDVLALPDHLVAQADDLHGRLLELALDPDSASDVALEGPPAAPAAEQPTSWPGAEEAASWRPDQWTVWLRSHDLALPDMLAALRARAAELGYEGPADGIRLRTISGNAQLADMALAVVAEKIRVMT